MDAKRFSDFGKQDRLFDKQNYLFFKFQQICASGALARNFGALTDMTEKHFHLAGKRYTLPVGVFPISENVP